VSILDELKLQNLQQLMVMYSRNNHGQNRQQMSLLTEFNLPRWYHWYRRVFPKFWDNILARRFTVNSSCQLPISSWTGLFVTWVASASVQSIQAHYLQKFFFQ